MRKAKLAIFLGIFLLFSLLFVFKEIEAQSSEGTDAIAVRIIPNPNHYSVYRWYSSQGFKGSPQALSVDGYEAVRDGRTVYVNAANVKNKSIYTNIYLISYNQDPSPKTVDILGQIVKYWKFNNDLVEQSNPGPQCAISALPCLSDTDCAKEQFCATTTVAVNSCQLKKEINCMTDDDCPQNLFCNSIKSKIIRDLKRIGQTEELKEALSAYKSEKGSYPKLAAGSYLGGHTISVWPSWTQEFLPALTMAQNIIDPINRLGACNGFDLITCWNKDTKRFVYDPQPSYLMLPTGSYGFVYKTDANGSNYNLCAVMETREATPELNFQFAPNNPASSDCVTATGIISGGTTANTAPRIIDAYLTGEADQELNGSLKVIDDQGNPISWNFNTGGENWAGWSAAPILKNTNNSLQKKIFAAKAGGPRTYNATLTLSDGQGGTLSTTTPIIIVNTKPFVESDNGEYSLNPNSPFIYSFYFSDSNLANPADAYTVTKLSGPTNFDMLSFSDTIVPAGPNRYKVTYQGTIPTTNKFYVDTEYSYRIAVKDKYNSTTTKDFKIFIKIEPPVLTFNCPTSQRLGKSYSCFLGYATQGNHDITYTGTNLPVGLAINLSNTANETGNNEIQSSIPNKFIQFISRLLAPIKLNIAEASTKLVGVVTPPINTVVSAYLSGTPTVVANKQVTIKATNEYGASSTKIFGLNINNYCGDGQKQEPNTEGRGGMYNDGYEDCDQTAGLSLSQGKPVVSTNPNLQYGCATINSSTPYPIPNNNYCIYKSPVENGGYCGDGYCQLQVVYNGATVNVEDGSNCAADCNPSCTPSCAGKDCGTDGCGGDCGACDPSKECSNGLCVVIPPLCGTCGNHICDPTETVPSCAFDCTYGACLKDSEQIGWEEQCAQMLNQSNCDPTHCVWAGGYCSARYPSPEAETCWALATKIACNNLNGCIWDATAHKNNLWCGDNICSTAIGESEICCAEDCNNTCTPNCAGKVCGPDGCGGTCAPNNCGTLRHCSGGACVLNCVPDCSHKSCGTDGCGGSCGTCTYPKICKENGNCCEANCHGCIGGYLQAANWQICGGQCCEPGIKKCCNDTCIPINSNCDYM